MAETKDFYQNTLEIVTKMKKRMNDAVNETTVELFSESVAKTPIKTGKAISSWEASVGAGTSGVDIFYYNDKENATTNWSRTKAKELAEEFKQRLRPFLYTNSDASTYRLSNDSPYILKLENGGYTDKNYFSEKPPYYTNRTTPFTLTSGGMSKKAPNGMVKVTVMRAPSIFHDKYKKAGN